MASALVQMTAFSPCSQLGDMIMMGMEASLESFPGSREDGNKRSHSDGDEDQDRNYVKKRRKQSKPIRITANDIASDNKPDFHPTEQRISVLDFSVTGEHFLSEGLPQVNSEASPSTDDYEDLSQINQEPKETYDDNQEKNTSSDKNYEPILPLNLSSIKSTTSDTLIVPSVSDSQNVANKDQTQQFQSLTQEVKNSVTQEGNSYLSQSPSLLLPLIRQNQIPGQIPQGSSQIRIFNPEAFCDLCNKEFCNKYFLKTHKANKHGIYTENTSGPTPIDPLLLLPFTNYFSINNESFENPSNFQAAKNLLSQNSYSTNRTVVKKTQGTQPQQSSLFSLKSNSSGNMRALCNICQREFCNKYFVRRHKLKIHGIVEPASKDSTLDMQDYNLGNNNSSQDKPDISTTEMEVYNSSYSKQFQIPNFKIEKQELPPKVEINLEKPKEKQEKEAESEIQIPIPISSDSISFFQVPQNEENNKENSLSSIRMKKLGVVNADAFCDICCKEYCNKYFLRTHKLKSHGIPPVEEKKEDMVNGTTANNFWYQNQAAPLNLIVNESSSNKDVTNKGSYDVDGEECVCGVCGRYFQSQFLLKMHQAYTHSNSFPPNEAVSAAVKHNISPFDKDTTESERFQKQYPEHNSMVIKSEYTKETDDNDHKQAVNPENLQKLQTLISRLNNHNTNESSLCDVCERDVGHVSLLESHILKEHASLLEEMGNFTEEENSSSQGSLIGSIYNLKKECPHCQKTFFKSSLLEQHIHEVHSEVEHLPDSQTIKGPMEFNENSCTKLVPFIPQQSEERPGIQTPTSSFCEICKKELCNKYFMKTHMQRMHGISIENGSQIGGVVCDICNKELCSKYFLRVHKQNSHGIFDELFLPQLGMDFNSNSPPNSDPALKPMDQADLTHRYFSHFTEVCTICSRRFRSVKWLKAHLWNDHGEEGKEKWKEVFLSSSSESKGNQFEGAGKAGEFPAMFTSTQNQSSNMFTSGEVNQNGKDTPDKQGLVDKNMFNNTMFSMIMNGKDSESKQYQCSYCSFTTTILAFLFIHERTHMNNQTFQSVGDQQFQCPICFQNSNSKENFEKHMKLHKMPWQQPFQSSTSSQELQKAQSEQSETKSDFTTLQDRITRQDQEMSGTSSASNVLPPNNSKSISLPSNQADEQMADSSLHCTRCGFKTGSVQTYLDHLTKDHPFQQMDQDLPSHLQLVEKVLSNLAANAGIPAVVALPQVQEQVTMQPFVLEDSEYASDLNSSIDPKSGKTFLSSLVFLPVKEKLKKSVTASFKLTPT
ncbi:uncharacterized protein LOC128997878 [Macrosteles quadrilineatus]|uniref:uncharacterized protein LOC128997878 n=1 Tax=Macrosteles quadrilineatus TaxID=74068 RepID=UPI0023E2FA4D|nr:uncharacterized protein LOC128997878 [Macrosteles quadrilineatus]